MSLAKVKQRALKIADRDKRDVRTQFGALCWRRQGDEVQVLLVTSKRTRRWILPKGWPQHGATPAQAAATEAWEEAGATGKVSTVCLGIYSYDKDMEDDVELPCVVALFPLKVKRLDADWPEMKKRRRRWFSLKKAAELVREPELASILRQFDPSML